MKTVQILATAVVAFVGVTLSTAASAANVAIVQGSYYTPNLKNALVGAGETVTEITSYDATTLAAFDSVIHYGNSYTDTGALETYVNGGGNLVLTPWAGNNFAIPSALQVFDNGGGYEFSNSSLGMTVLAAGDPLLAGVTFPGFGTFSAGRISSIMFDGSATQVANWSDGTAMVGRRTSGAGTVVGINMHVITSDTAYGIIDTPWATQLFVNAVSGADAVPEPAMLGLFGFGAVALGLARRRK